MFFCSLTCFSQEESINVPFAVIEDIPRFPKCIDASIKEAKECFNQEMFDHVMNNFNYPKKARRDNIQGRIFVLFLIDFEGNVSIIDTKTPVGCELLRDEAIRIIKLLPKFKPGEQKGKPVGVSYAQPINFKLN
tara:strand:+ start:213270 stop:213671 length:402 start_codon:yes stop_codon:yes gene_type:complete